ncbi:hypothetical protein Poly41_13680 [Novipirellula artificiosorum]|uniref:Uncharacterized protein n=1 Tax=Novipirellula artificiosorum TaxID=2528016 RepID=A0A5C6DW04_9BACT|nr:hypothetical protein Poly41_13680 [Novipirellula artificiosorum]
MDSFCFVRQIFSDSMLCQDLQTAQTNTIGEHDAGLLSVRSERLLQYDA